MAANEDTDDVWDPGSGETPNAGGWSAARDRALAWTRGVLTGGSGTVRLTVVAIGAVAVLALLWILGGLNPVLPATNGIIQIESPQIYTRERLVNDRFREQAWLERQLEELEERADTISSYRTRSLTFDATVSAGAVAPAPEGSEQPEAPARPSPEAELLVSADDSFNLQRNIRAAIRRALIENELDDRHDLGSNSLYQFNFGASIIAGPRTRRIAAIEMELEPVQPLEPLDEIVDREGSRCAGLYQFECAYLFDTGILTEPDEAEALDLEYYRRWRHLFNEWLDAENMAYGREADEVRRLLGSREASQRIEQLLRPFFDGVNADARGYIAAFNQVSQRAPLGERDCQYVNTTTNSVEKNLRNFVHDCIDNTNNRLADGYAELDDVKVYLAGEGFAVTQLDGVAEAEIWGQFFRTVFRGFNDQCAWGENFVLEREIRDRTVVLVNDTIAETLLNCITIAIIRDYGSHWFGQVQDQEASLESALGNPSGARSVPSDYQAREGLSSIVSTSQRLDLRSEPRTEYVGVIARREAAKTKASDGDASPAPPIYFERAPSIGAIGEACGHHAGAGDIDEAPLPALGISNSYYLGIVFPNVDAEIGWRLLAHFICSTYATDGEAPTPTVVDGQYVVPIGLFRFISILSDGQKSFSYSVQPSGAFNLHRRDEERAWNLETLLGAGTQNGRVAAGGGATESWIDKQYQIIGFGGQVDETSDANRPRVRRAKFGWYIFPAAGPGGWMALPVLESANVKLSAVVSVPAWWESVDIKVTTTWYDPSGLERQLAEARELQAAALAMPAPGTRTSVKSLRVELPRRLEFIRNQFPNTATGGPSLYQLHLPRVTVQACQKASILLKGERLWRSTVVSLGGQKSSLIEVMPDMRGIIAHFDPIIPPPGGFAPLPLTIWTSEGRKEVLDNVSLFIPEAIDQRMKDGEAPCPNDRDADSQDG